MEECASQRTKQASELVSDRANRQVNEAERASERTTSERASERLNTRTNERIKRANERMHECTHEPTCDWANLASEPSERSEATKAAVESGRSSGRAERRAKNTGRWQRCLPLGAELTPEPSHRSCAKGAEMSQLKTDEQDGAAEATRPMGWVREGKRCAHPKRHRPGGGRLRRARPVFFLAHRDARYFTPR